MNKKQEPTLWYSDDKKFIVGISFNGYLYRIDTLLLRPRNLLRLRFRQSYTASDFFRFETLKETLSYAEKIMRRYHEQHSKYRPISFSIPKPKKPSK